MILIVDFGSQTAHLISRRLQSLGSSTKLVSPENALDCFAKIRPQGIILSGGPSSVYEKGAPTIKKALLEVSVPILGICYGLQLSAKLLGGKVIPGRKEYGPAKLQFKIHPDSIGTKFKIAEGLPNESTVWMSHGDEVVSLPKGFRVIGATEHVPFAFVAHEEKRIYGVQFHPEVEHTEFGRQILSNFISICGVKTTQHAFSIEEMKQNIRQRVGDAYVIGAVSGGVDSTVAGLLAADALGERFIPVYVDNGLMREGTEEHVEKIFTNRHVKPIVVDGVEEMLKRLAGITDPEEKRKIIGNFYIELFEDQMEHLLALGKSIEFLLQGTIYSDVIESQGTKHASKIKSHHNVGGLPEKMKLKLLEPLRELYKDEVRSLGKKLGLSDEFVYKQPFPGPGYAVRIRGEVTRERLERAKIADKIVLDELEKAGFLHTVFQSFPVMTGVYSTAVKGDGKFFGEVIALRVVETNDIMTATWPHLPYEVLQTISSRIVNEVGEISRVVYDITTKPPATMEWE